MTTIDMSKVKAREPRDREWMDKERKRKRNRMRKRRRYDISMSDCCFTSAIGMRLQGGIYVPDK